MAGRNRTRKGGSRMSKPKIETVLKALAKYGIHNEKELNEAIEKMKPINIGCMVSPVNGGRIEDGVKA